MKLTPLALLLAAGLSATAVQAHFQLLHTPETQLDEPTEIPLRLVFGHPLDNGYVMDMAAPEEFFVSFRGERTDLKERLQAIQWTGPDNQAQAHAASFKITRNGDYIFAVVPAPYLETQEDAYIQQFTKSFVNKGGLPTGWQEPLGLPTEILPLSKPYQLFTGGTFTGQVLREGAPAAGIECEVELINTTLDVAANRFGQETLASAPPSPIVVLTDDQGRFTFGFPRAGTWGFACLGSGPVTEHAGKELSQDAVLWVTVRDWE